MGIRIEVLQKCHTSQMQYITRCMVQESKYAAQAVDDDAIVDAINRFVEDEGKTCQCFIAVLDDAEIIGFFALQLETYPFRHGLCARDLAFYVMPEWRGSFAAAKLLLRAYEWAKEAQADAFYMEITAPVDEAPAQKLFEKVGFTKHGVVMRKEL